MAVAVVELVILYRISTFGTSELETAIQMMHARAHYMLLALPMGDSSATLPI